MIAVDERGLTSADWTVYNNGTKRTRNSSAPTSGIITTLPLALRKDGTWYTYGWDITNNICEIFGPAGYIRTTYTYTPYGQATAEGDTEQLIQWSSEFNDTELGLIYYNYRCYNPVYGSWQGRDCIPSTFFCNNLYTYIYNSPCRYLDVLGMLSCWSSLYCRYKVGRRTISRQMGNERESNCVELSNERQISTRF